MAIHRTAARMLLLDPNDRVLLLRGIDPGRPEAGSWWFTPGGEVEPGETAEEAARREVLEETGILVRKVGPVVLRRRVHFEFEGRSYAQDELFFAARSAVTLLDFSSWTEVERRTLLEVRWWTRKELRATAETVYPLELVEVLEQLPLA